MNKAVFVLTPYPYSGKSVVTLGMVQMLQQKFANVGYFKPVLDGKEKKEDFVNTVLSNFGLNLHHDQAYVFTQHEVSHLQNQGNSDQVFDAIIKRFKEFEAKFDFVVVDGNSFNPTENLVSLNFNISLARSLNIPSVLVLKDNFTSEEDLHNHILTELTSLLDKSVRITSVFITKATNNTKALLTLLQEKYKDVSFYFLPEDKELSLPTVKEIISVFDAEILSDDCDIHQIPSKIMVGGMEVEHYLGQLTEKALVLIPADRSDIILATAMALSSTNYPKISGILLYGESRVEASVLDMLYEKAGSLPVFFSEKDTYGTVEAISRVRTRIYPECEYKIKKAIELFDNSVNKKKILEGILSYVNQVVTPRLFQYNMIKKAKELQKHIVLPEGEDDRIVSAAVWLANDEISKITILGDASKIKNRASELGLKWNDERIAIENPATSDKYELYWNKLYELRKEKGMTQEQAKELMLDVSYFGTMMVFMGEADGMVSGAINTTAHTIRPSLQFVKTKAGVKTVSSVFFMLLENRVVVYGDCAIVPNPTSEQLAEIAITSADSAKAFGIEPAVALLSYSSGNSGSGEDVDRVRTATALVKELRPDILVEGPIQYDAAVDPVVGAQKMPNSPVAGKANVLVFPELNAGNTAYKAVQRETGTVAIGPILQGLRKPVNDLSRGASVVDIYNTVVITAIQADSM